MKNFFKSYAKTLLTNIIVAALIIVIMVVLKEQITARFNGFNPENLIIVVIAVVIYRFIRDYIIYKKKQKENQ